MGTGDSLSQTFSKTIHQLLDIRKCANFNATKKEMHKHNIAPCRIFHLSQKQLLQCIIIDCGLRDHHGHKMNHVIRQNCNVFII